MFWFLDFIHKTELPQHTHSSSLSITFFPLLQLSFFLLLTISGLNTAAAQSRTLIDLILELIQTVQLLHAYGTSATYMSTSSFFYFEESFA